MTIPLPVLPPEPPATADAATVAAWWQRVDVLLRVYALAQHLEISAESTAASRAHAAAQQATADAMVASVAAQHALADAMQAPAPARLPTRAELVFAMVRDQPQATVLTPSMVVKGAMDIVDAYVLKHPTAVSG